MRSIITIFILLFVFTKSFSQYEGTRDSLTRVLQTAKEDTSKVKLLYKLGDVFQSIKPDSAALYYREGGALSEKLGFTTGRMSFYRKLGYIFAVQAQYDSLLKYSLQSLELAKSLKDTFNTGVSLFNVGIAYRFKSDLEKAIEYNLEGAKLLEGKGYKNIESGMYDGLQVLYMTLGVYDKAIFYGEKAVNAARVLKSDDQLAVALSNLAMSYMEVDRWPDAKKVAEEAISIAKKINDKSVEGAASNNLADIAIREGDFTSLKKYAELGFSANEAVGNLEGAATSKRGLAIYYLSQQDFNKAKALGLEALATSEENGFLGEKARALETLSQVQFASRDFRSAYDYFLKSKAVEAQVFNEKIAEKEATQKVKYETEKKDNQIKLQNAVIQRKNVINYLLIGGALTLLVVSFLLYRTHRQKQRIQQQRIVELETEKKLTATEAVLKGEEQERSRLAKDLHDGLGGMLSGIKYSLNTMKGNLVMTPANAQAFERSMDMLDSSIKEMRRVAHNMMPEALLKFGLDAALKDFCNDISNSGALPITYQSIGLDNAKLSETTAITIYRIVQELINNTLKHAGAKTALVQVSMTAGMIAVTVEDDGKGFDTSVLKKTGGIGWSNIQNRVDFLKGKLDVQSDSLKGTSVHIELNAQ